MSAHHDIAFDAAHDVEVQRELGETMPATLEAVHPVLMVRNVTRSIAFYERLGFALAFKDLPVDPRYAGMRRDGVELHFQWHDEKEWDFPNDRPTYRFLVAEVDTLAEEFRALDANLDWTDVRDTPWGTREFHVRDPDSNGLHFYRDL